MGAPETDRAAGESEEDAATRLVMFDPIAHRAVTSDAADSESWTVEAQPRPSLVRPQSVCFAGKGVETCADGCGRRPDRAPMNVGHAQRRPLLTLPTQAFPRAQITRDCAALGGSSRCTSPAGLPDAGV